MPQVDSGCRRAPLARHWGQGQHSLHVVQ
jgi:hypothetical protein